jgi:drug/metabolite transporter (DMT)-like permease
MTEEERKGILLVAAAVALFSTSPVFIVWADPMDPLVKTWGRLTVAALAVGAASVFQRRDAIPVANEHERGRAALRFAGYGLIAALHFFFYITSLSFTTAAHSLAIIYTAPIFVTLLSAWLLKEPTHARQWLGVVVAVVGVFILSGLEPRLNERILFGDFLALLSAVTFGFYSVAGRYERERYPLLVYASRVYGVAALWLLPVALLTLPSARDGSFGAKQVLSVVAMGLGSLALGHTLYNAALRRVHATYVNIIASQEVTGGIILSWLILAQVPSLNSLVGALVTLVGTGMVLKSGVSRVEAAE